MKNHELLDLIGEANEDYVLEAGNNVTRPRFGWKTLAACAACAALVLTAYPVYRMAQRQPASGLLPLHDYTVMEGGGILDTQGGIKAAAGNIGGEPATMPGGAYVGNDGGGESGIDGANYSIPGQDAPAQETAMAQYDSLLQNLGAGTPEEQLLAAARGEPAGAYPAWYGGSWIDNSYYPEAKLAVAIVDGFRTQELEAQITEWCGGEVVFKDVKYSWSHLDQLMTPVTEALKGTGLSCGLGVDVMGNCLGVDLYSDGAEVPNEVLVKLAQLDPQGDAIRVRVFTQSMSTLTDEIGKGPEPGGKTEPVYNGEAVPGAVEDAGQETAQPVRQIEEPPQQKEPRIESKYDAIAE